LSGTVFLGFKSW